MSSMVIGLASGSVEKLLVTATVVGGALALDMDVDIYLLLGGARAFRKDVAGTDRAVYDYPQLKDEMTAGLAQNAIPDPIAMLRGLKQDGHLHVHVCATAGKIWGASQTTDFIDLVDDIVGIGEYVIRSGEAEVAHMV